jgi:hypothetical protein
VNSIFNLPHIFIVFNPGSGGNFLAGIFNRLLNSNLQSINIAKDGSSHTLVNNKINGTDFLSFGTLIEEHEPFKSENDREQFYLANIEKHYVNVTDPQVVWTHDFTNIPLYRKHFKNAKIFVVTNDTDQEQMTTIIMNISKTLLGNDAAIPLSTDVWEFALERWRAGCMPELCKLVSVDRAKEILADRLNPANKEILEHVSIRIFLWYYKMLELIEPGIKVEQRVFNNVLYPTRNSPILYKVGNTLESYIVDKCIVLPYNYLLNNDSDLLIAKITELFDRTISEEEQNFIKNSFIKYRSAQNQILLTDPVKYYNDLKNKVT